MNRPDDFAIVKIMRVALDAQCSRQADMWLGGKDEQTRQEYVETWQFVKGRGRALLTSLATLLKVTGNIAEEGKVEDAAREV